MAKLRFAVWLPTYAWADAGPEHVRRLTESIRTCEEHDLDVWVIDHLLAAPGLYGVAWLEPLSVLAYAAALTQKVRLATGILVLPVRHPVVLAKEISTLCHISGGRFVLGIGPGWYSREFDVTGSRIEERGGRTDEILEAVTRLLSRPNASYQGRYYQFQDVTIDPRPPTLPEIWVSGGSRVPDPRDGGSDAFLQGLLAPVRSGMVLVRSDLTRAARALGLGLRMGERRFALTSLLSQDSEGTLGWLAAEASAWEQRHLAREAAQAATGEIARFWTHRAGTAAALLTALRT